VQSSARSISIFLCILTAVVSEIFRVTTSDADLGEDKRCAYSILPRNDGSKFVMETVDNTGVIKVNEVCSLHKIPRVVMILLSGEDD